MLYGIKHLLAESPASTWAWRHVKGHLDDHARYEDLDPWSQLNVDMDQLAKTYWRVLNQNRPPPFSLPPRPGEWTIWVGNYRFPTWMEDVVHRHVYNRTTATYWGQKLRSNNVFTEYDWAASCMAYRLLSTGQQLWLPKWLASFLPIGRNLHRWNDSNSSHCPRCDDEEGHRHHVLRCQHKQHNAIPVPTK